MTISAFLLSEYIKAETTRKYIDSYLDNDNLYTMSEECSIADLPYVEEKSYLGPEGDSNTYASQFEKRIIKEGWKKYHIDNIVPYISAYCKIMELEGETDYHQELTDREALPQYPSLIIYVGRPMAETIKYPIEKGQSFKNIDWNLSDGTYPAIAGYDFMRKFKVGDILETDSNFQPKSTIKVRIIGFLEKNTQVLENFSSMEVIDGDKTLIIAVDPLTEKNEYFKSLQTSMLSTSTFIQTGNPMEVEEVILEIAKKEGYRGKEAFIRIYPALDNARIMMKVNHASYRGYLAIAAGTDVAALILVLISVVVVIRKNRYDYGVILLNGGSKRNILREILAEIGFVAFSSLLAGGIIVFRFIGDLTGLLSGCIYFLLYMAIACLAGYVIMRKRPIMYFIDRRED